MVSGDRMQAKELLALHKYTFAQRWAASIRARLAVAKGRKINRVWGDKVEQVPERH